MSDLRTRPTALYRFFDENDRLLYVGITTNDDARFQQHKSTATWWPNKRWVTVEWFPDRATAEDAERLAIRNEGAAHNVNGYGSTPTPLRTFRIDPSLWERFGESATSADSDRSALARDLIRWYAREPGAKLPKRPDPPPGPAPEQPVTTGEGTD